MIIELTKRQDRIVQIVKDEGPITGEKIAEQLHVTRATLRPDLAILTMSGILDARPRVGYFYSGKSTMQAIGENIRKRKVQEVKAVPVLINQDTSVYDAICTMFLEDVGTLFIVDQHNDLAGVASRKDLLRSAIGRHQLEELPVSVIMTRMPNLVLTFPDEALHEAAQKMITHQIDSLPVVVESESESEPEADAPTKYKVIGRITKTTITRSYFELGNEGM